MQKSTMMGLAVLLAMLLFITACSPSTPSADTAAATPAPAAPAPAANDPAPADSGEADEPETGARPKITVAVMDFGTFPSERGTMDNSDITAWINENSPIEIEFVVINRNEVGSIYTSMLAAGTAPDIMSDYSVENWERFVMDGSLLELDDLIQEYGQNLLAIVPAEVIDWGRYNGKLYGIPRTRDEIAVPNWMTFIRQDWLDNLGLEMPTTFDEFYEVMRAFTYDDPTGTGATTYGYGAGSAESDTSGAGFEGFERIMNTFGAMRDRWYPNEDGSYDYVLITEANKDAYAYCERLYDDGLVDPEFFTKTGQENRTMFVNGELGTTSMQTGSFNITYLTALLDVNADANPVAVPSLESKYGRHAYLHERAAQMHIFMPTTCSDPAAAVQYLDWMVAGPWEKIQYGDEGVWFERVDGRIVPIGDAQERSVALNGGGQYSNAYGYNRTADDLQLQLDYARDSMSPVEIKSLEIQIHAINTSMELSFPWYLPTLHLGLESSNTLIPQLQKFAVDTYRAAVIDKNVTVEQAYETIKNEFDVLGYPALREEYNARAKELGY